MRQADAAYPEGTAAGGRPRAAGRRPEDPIETHHQAWTALLGGDHLWLTDALRDSPDDAVLWECTPTSRAHLDRPFAMHTTRTAFPDGADARPFRAHLAGPGPDVRVFDSLGGDARLVAPVAESGVRTGHLLAFVRSAPDAWAGRLWAAVAREVFAWTDARPDPVWVSTHGHGVLWLHVRLDRRPKYYVHGPFRAPPG